MRCEICNKQFKSLGTHVLRSHNIIVKEYYDKYLKKETDGHCLKCGNDTSFLGLGGYNQFCSIKCSASHNKTKQKRKNTCLKKYGVEHHLQNNEILQKQIETFQENME